MDFLERKSSNLLQRLKRLQLEQCCLHISQQIGLTLDQVQEKDERTIGCFLSNLKHLESFDSDATESTSSNDSYDELEGFSHEDIPKRSHHLCAASLVGGGPGANAATGGAGAGAGPTNYDEHPNLKRKAIWKYACERSRLASRWVWLQAQIADLEFKIRNQNDATLYARSCKSSPIAPFRPEESCSRTVPISKDFRRRRLIRSSKIMADSNRSSVKFSQVPCVCSSLPQTVGPCLSCNGRYNYLKQSEADNMSVSERVSLLDPCFHPVLSFPDDLTIESQLSYLLKQEVINRKPTKGKPGRKKGSTAANLAAAHAAAAAAAASADGNGKQTNLKGKYYRGMVGRPPGSTKNQSQTMITSNKLRRKYRKQSSSKNYYSHNNWPVGSANGPAGSSANQNNQNNNHTRRYRRIRRASSMNDSSVCSESSNHYRSSNFLLNSAQNVSRRRRSEQNAYDIDNIVIPFSIAATTRVEILEYKEIVTPSWRVWENGTCQAENAADEEVEDTSDEAYINRHTKGEGEEKKRFSLKPPKNRVDIQCTPPMN